MTKNPVLNALAAAAYISIIGLVMNWGTKFAPKSPTVLAPIAIISLFTLSAAVMGYLFCFQPIQLYFDRRKKQAVTVFLQTVLVFGCLTFIALALLFSGILR
jgi:hypothetical protein